MVGAVASEASYQGDANPPLIHVLLHYSPDDYALYLWHGDRLEPVATDTTPLQAWAELAKAWGHVQQLVYATTPAGPGWLMARPGPQVGSRALACMMGPDAPLRRSAQIAVENQLTMAMQLALARHQLQVATVEFNHLSRELHFGRHLANMLRQPMPAARLRQELAQRLRELLGVEALWIWPETDLRKRPIQDHAEPTPDRRGAADARRVAETVMTQGECRVVRLSAPFVGVPLLLASTVHGAIVGRLCAGQSAPSPLDLDLLRSVAGYVILALDYTDTQRQTPEATAEENAAEAGIREAAGSFAHELNNLLASICLQAEVGADSTDDSELAEHFEAIRGKVLRSAQIVRRLQGLADSSPQQAPGELVDLGELVHDLVERHWDAWRERLAVAGSELRLQAEYAENLHVMGSPTELTDLITKLVNNALEAMPRGGDLEIRLLRDGQDAVLRVRDSGLGMTPDILERAGEPFYTTKHGDHVGLGLTIVRSICAGARGRLVLASEPGVGTTAEVILPVAQRSDAQTSSVASSHSDTQPMSLSILVADDDATFLHSMTVLLRRMGHRVTAACDGREAIGLLRHGAPFDILLLDLSMPEMGGWEVARLARQLQPNASILLLTGWGERAATINDGRLDQVLSKPISLEALAEAVTNCEARRRTEAVRQQAD